ncbi:MAG: hypothetical protein JNM10_09725 [Planctomycetia bacterium]|nr:hypothetical protein [Planctomycetia bacterium]
MLTLLALAADRHGASCYGRVRMAQRLGMAVARVDLALERLKDLGLVDHRPWRHGDPDGVWQLTSLPPRDEPRSATGATRIGDLLGACSETTDALRAAAGGASRRHSSSACQEHAILLVPRDAPPGRSPEIGSFVSSQTLTPLGIRQRPGS